DPSHARLEVRAGSAAALDEILAAILDHGAVPTTARDCAFERADMGGAFPENFYSTTNYRTHVRLSGKWVEVEDQEMDCGIVLDLEQQRARCLAMVHVKKGDPIIVGRQGLRVLPAE